LKYLLILACVVLNSAAQLLMKYGVSAWKLSFVVSGVLCLVASLFVWLFVLAKVPVSYAYPCLSAGYIITAIAAYYLLGESMPYQKIVGICIICCGIATLSLGGK
jgi:multidrug transporter EmrE-like cation transporter